MRPAHPKASSAEAQAAAALSVYFVVESMVAPVGTLPQ